MVPGKAQYNLACRYVKGDGVEQDLPKAIALLQQATDAGLDKPARALRRLMRHQRKLERQHEEEGEESGVKEGTQGGVCCVSTLYW